jgi:hypothetical protein
MEENENVFADPTWWPDTSTDWPTVGRKLTSNFRPRGAISQKTATFVSGYLVQGINNDRRAFVWPMENKTVLQTLNLKIKYLVPKPGFMAVCQPLRRECTEGLRLTSDDVATHVLQRRKCLQGRSDSTRSIVHERYPHEKHGGGLLYD